MKNFNYLMDIISNKSSRSMKYLLLNHQSKCISTKFEIELQSKLKFGNLVNFDTSSIQIVGIETFYPAGVGVLAHFRHKKIRREQLTKFIKISSFCV